MLSENVVYVFCRPGKRFQQSPKESIGIGNEKERNTRSFGLISDEPV